MNSRSFNIFFYKVEFFYLLRMCQSISDPRVPELIRYPILDMFQLVGSLIYKHEIILIDWIMTYDKPVNLS